MSSRTNERSAHDRLRQYSPLSAPIKARRGDCAERAIVLSTTRGVEVVLTTQEARRLARWLKNATAGFPQDNAPPKNGDPLT